MDDRQPAGDDEVRRYWQFAAGQERDADGLRPTARDPWLQQAIERVIEGHLAAGDMLIDVGCGDGLSTIRFAKGIKRAIGVDYIEAFVAQARANAARLGVDSAQFRQANVLDLSSVILEKADVATSIRCLINLASPSNQRRAIAEIAKCVRPGGRYLASEGWSEGMAGLNAIRVELGLDPIVTVKHNLLMSRGFFESAVADYFDIESYRSLGLYLLISRVLQPACVEPAPPRHDHKLNEIACQMLQLVDGDLLKEADYAGIYVLRRKS